MGGAGQFTHARSVIEHFRGIFLHICTYSRWSLIKMEEEGKQSLFLWQRAAFYGSDGGARGAADSLRLRLAHLEFLHCKE